MGAKQKGKGVERVRGPAGKRRSGPARGVKHNAQGERQPWCTVLRDGGRGVCAAHGSGGREGAAGKRESGRGEDRGLQRTSGRGGPGDALHLPQRRGLRRSAPPRRSRLPRPSSCALPRGCGGAGPAERAAGARAGLRHRGVSGDLVPAALGVPDGVGPGRGAVALCLGPGPPPPWGAEPAVCPPAAGARQAGSRQLFLRRFTIGWIDKGL